MDTAYAVPDRVWVGVRRKCCDCKYAVGCEDMDHVADTCGEALRGDMQDKTGEDVGECAGFIRGGEMVNVDLLRGDFWCWYVGFLDVGLQVVQHLRCYVDGFNFCGRVLGRHGEGDRSGTTADIEDTTLLGKTFEDRYHVCKFDSILSADGSYGASVLFSGIRPGCIVPPRHLDGVSEWFTFCRAITVRLSYTYRSGSRPDATQVSTCTSSCG